MTTAPKADCVSATVTKVVQTGKGWYAVTLPDRTPRLSSQIYSQDRSITFSNDVWSPEETPKIGQTVVLEGILRFHGGLRAMHARPKTPEQR